MKTTKRKIKLLLLAAPAVALAFAALAASTGSETTVIFPHDMHVEGMGMECETCHMDVGESTTGTDNLMPGMDVCGACHDIEDTDNCTLCHTDMENLDVYQRVVDYSPKFNHQAHIGQEMECSVCHSGVSASTTAQEEHLPPMEPCMTCHDGMRADNDCFVCHDQRRGPLPEDHLSALWMRQHGDDAKMDDAQSCMMCHERETSCMECHEGDNLLFGSRAHPPGYEFKHPVDVRSGRMECASCHESRRFCQECHIEENVYPRSHQSGLWAGRTTGGRHAVEARMDIEQCASCHAEEPTEDPVCVVCHGN